MSPFANCQRAEFTLDGTNVRAELPVLHPTIGAPMVDARLLYREAGCLIYDPALGETGICQSSITYADGDNGILL